MSNHIMDRIWWREDFDDLIDHLKDELPGSGRSLKWVLVALADNASDEGFCWPSVDTIAQKTSLTTRSVQRAIKQAIRLGILRRRLRTNNTSQYLFNLDLLPQGKPGKTKRGGVTLDDFESEPDLFETANDPFLGIVEDLKDGVTFMQQGVPAATDGVTSTTPRGDTLSPKPSIEPPLEPSEEPLGADAPDDDFGLTFADDLPLKNFIASEWTKLKADFPEVGECRRITEQMVGLIKTRTQEHRTKGESDHDLWREVFVKIRSSHFLTGRAPPGPGRTTRFHLTLSWLLKPHLFREVINGKYTSSRVDDGAFDPSTGEVLGPAAAATRGTIERLRNARQRGRSGGHPHEAGLAGG